MIAAIVPAHNEEMRLGECLRSLSRAGACTQLGGEEVRIIVVLDDCRDGTARIAQGWPVQVIGLRARNVGLARALGAAVALAQGARWLSFTDADSVVAPDWIAAQLGEAAHCVCGTVEVADWSAGDSGLRTQYESRYRDAPGHRHIHGANLGVCARAYERAGGFAPLRAHEDVALVRALQASGARIAWSNRPRVQTSARLDCRAPEGFGAHLARLRQQVQGAAFIALEGWA